MRKITLLIVFLALFTETVKGYKINGEKWPSASYSYYYNPTGVDDAVDYSGKLGQVQSGIQNWDAVATSSFSSQYLGTTTDQTWLCDDGTNSKNTIIWKTNGWGGSVIGVCCWSYGGNTIYEADIKLNTSFSNDSRVPLLVMHEAGHGIGMGHTKENGESATAEEDEAVMHWQMDPGTAQNCQDNCALTAIYPSGGCNPPNTADTYHDCAPCCGGTSSTYSISGNISGATSVTVTLSGSSSSSTTTDGSGNYSFTGLSSGNFTVTPSKTGYAFTPTSRSYSSLSSDQTNQDFTATAETYDISGNISGATSVTVTLSGSSSSSTTTDGSGNYSFTGLSSGNYTVTPSKTGYVFTPASRSYSPLSSDQTNQDFNASLSLPDLTAAPNINGWDDALVLSRNQGGFSTDDDPLIPGEYYINSVSKNQGDGDAVFSAGQKILSIEVDGNAYGTLYASARKKNVLGPMGMAAVFIREGEGRLGRTSLLTTWAAGTAIGTEANNSVNLSAGQHTLTLIMDPDDVINEDNEGNNTYNRIITIEASNEAPQAVITSPTDGGEYETGEEIVFSGTFTDSDGTVQAYEWKTYKEEVLLETVATEGFNRTYNETGDYRVTVKCQDDDGSWSVLADADFTVVPDNYPPTCEITTPAENAVVNQGDALDFAANFTDRDGTIAVYSWEVLDGDGNQAGAGVQANFNFVFNQLGNFIVRARCQDNEGLWSQWDSLDVTVNEIPNEPPYAEIIKPANDTTVVKNQPIDFEGQGADTDGTVSAYEWKVFLNGSEQAQGDESEFTYTFPASGSYWVVLRCQDDDGDWSEPDSVLLTVEDQPNEPPLAFIDSPSKDTTLIVGNQVYFKGRGEDSDGSVSQYSWKIYKGDHLKGQQGQRNYFFTFSETGAFLVLFQCRDNDGAWSEFDTVRVTVTEEPNLSPTAVILNPSSDTAVIAPSSIGFSGEGNDEDGVVEKYLWSIIKENQLIGEDSNATFSYLFSSSGVYLVIFKCQDDDGAWSNEDSIQVEVDEAPNERPTAEIARPSSDTTIYLNEEISFDGNGEDEDGNVVAYLWEIFKNGGKIVQNDNKSFNKQFTSLGTYTAVFKCRDDDGAWSNEDSVRVDVVETPNEPPVAEIIQPSVDTSLWIGHLGAFKGIFSDPDGSVGLIEWKLLYQNELVEEWNNAEFSYRFELLGDYMLIARCRDNDEMWSRADTVIISVINDGVPPLIPAGVFVGFQNGVFTITWIGSPSEDIFSYNIYRDVRGFLAKKTEVEMIAENYRDTVFVDSLNENAAEVYYGIASVDYSGNESEIKWSDLITELVEREEKSDRYDYRIFPNPVNDRLRVSLSRSWLEEKTRLRIYNITGALEMERKVTGPEIFLDTKELKNGLYFIMINNNKHKKINKFTVLK